MIFCDTSTLAKYYVPEPESLEVQKLLNREDQVLLSEFARVELMAVFHRRLREKKWSQKEFSIALQQFHHDEIHDFWSWIPLEKRIIHQSAKAFTSLSEKIFLRSADCLHLVTAMQYHFSEIYTHDRHQADAAGAFGLQVVSIY